MRALIWDYREACMRKDILELAARHMNEKVKRKRETVGSKEKDLRSQAVDGTRYIRLRTGALAVISRNGVEFQPLEESLPEGGDEHPDSIQMSLKWKKHVLGKFTAPGTLTSSTIERWVKSELDSEYSVVQEP
jgi:hypothetical protein